MFAEWWNQEGTHKVYDEDKGEYTKYATEEDKKFGETLRNSGEEGQRQFDALTKSDAKIKVDFKDGVSSQLPGELGHLFIEKTKTDSNGKIILTEATLEIYQQGIADTHSEIMAGNLTSEKYDLTTQKEANIKTIKDNNLGPFDLAVAILGHEIGHTDNANVQIRVDAKKNGGKEVKNLDSEWNPQAIEGRILKELAKKRK